MKFCLSKAFRIEAVYFEIIALCNNVIAITGTLFSFCRFFTKFWPWQAVWKRQECCSFVIEKRLSSMHYYISMAINQLFSKCIPAMKKQPWAKNHIHYYVYVRPRALFENVFLFIVDWRGKVLFSWHNSIFSVVSYEVKIESWITDMCWFTWDQQPWSS